MKTKQILTLLGCMFLMVMLSLSTTSCTKEGPAGPAGADGADGKDGKDGENAENMCGDCHNFSEHLLAKIEQASNSTHSSGNAVDRAGVNCSECHTSMGFREFLTGGKSVAITQPTTINCRTCHKIHETYSPADYALRTTASLTPAHSKKAYDYGSSNLCVNCHQSRAIAPYPDLAKTETVTITTSRFGPHHGPQSNLFIGKDGGAIEIPGTMPYVNSAHTRLVTKGCVTCHMSAPVGISAGGHQMNVEYTSHGAAGWNLNGCAGEGCHVEAAADLGKRLAANRLEIQNLMKEFGDLLAAKGLLKAPITVSQTQAAALLNYRFVLEDQSDGAHNYQYIKALIVNSMAALNK